MVLIDGKEVEINGTRFIIHKAPATVAYNAALEYGMGQDNKDADAIMRAVYKLMAYVEIVLSDDRKVMLNNQEIINQHIKDMDTLLQLQKEVVVVNFTFSAKENH
jgi:hypothetical protein